MAFSALRGRSGQRDPSPPTPLPGREGEKSLKIMADTFTKAERSRIMAAVKGKDTAPELIVRRLVHGRGNPGRPAVFGPLYTPRQRR
jgi:hypothetical protein